MTIILWTFTVIYGLVTTITFVQDKGENICTALLWYVSCMACVMFSAYLLMTGG